jgi:hypothetical protein
MRDLAEKKREGERENNFILFYFIFFFFIYADGETRKISFHKKLKDHSSTDMNAKNEGE